MSGDWTELNAIFTDAVTAVQAMTDVSTVNAVSVPALTEAADAVPTKLDRFDLNGDNVIDLIDVTCISPYFGHEVDDTNLAYDTNCDGEINSADYLIVYQNMTA